MLFFAAFASSAIPPSAPITLEASSGIKISLLLSAVAISFNASIYFFGIPHPAKPIVALYFLIIQCFILILFGGYADKFGKWYDSHIK